MKIFKVVVTILVVIISAISLSHLAIAVNSPILPTDPAMTVDPTLVWMQAAGFPAWAGVVAWAAIRVTAEIKEIGNKLESHIVATERRLALLEFKLIETDKKL